MAKKDKAEELREKDNAVCEFYDDSDENCGGAFDDEIMDTPDSYDGDVHFSVGRHARTFSLPLEDVIYSRLLNKEKEGKASIFNKQYCPCPKEGAILVLCEYDIYFE